MELKDVTPIRPGRGLYTYKAVVTTGPILIQTKSGASDSFATITDGSIAATETGTIYIGDVEEIQVGLGASDRFYLNLAENGKQ